MDKGNQKYLDDISEIRKVMDRSSRFLSLTGWSGIMAGIYALAGAFVAYRIYYSVTAEDSGSFFYPAKVNQLFLLAAVVLALAVGTATVLAYRKSRKTGVPFWTAVTRRLLVNMLIPLLAGGAFVFILYHKGLPELMLPATLVFYGLSLINASKYTIDELWPLGVMEVALGLVAAVYTGYAIWLWAMGFGLLHIVYGAVMWYKYERVR